MAPENGNAAAIPQMIAVSHRDAERLRQAIARNYGFVPSSHYCRDLIAFIDKFQGGAKAPQKEELHETQ